MRVFPCSLIALVAFGFAAPARADTFCVGQGSFATHATIPAAVAAAAANGAGNDVIRLDTLTFALPDPLTIDGHSVEFQGGFPQCLPLAPTGISTIDGTGGVVGSVFQLRATDNRLATFVFDRVTIRGGGDDGTGGGLDIAGATVGVTLGPGVRITGNASSNGAGVLVNRGTLVLDGAVIDANTSLNQGGGVNCTDGTLRVFRRTSVRANSAARGGGYALLACTARFVGGSSAGLVNNQASESGGGIWAINESEITIVRGENDDPATIPASGAFQVRANVATRRGAGLYLAGGTRFAADGILVVDNTIDAASATPVPILGAGLFAGDGTFVRVGRDGRCPPRASCNAFVGNVIARNAATQPASGAAIGYAGAQRIEVFGAEIIANGITVGGDASAIGGSGVGGTFRLERVLIAHNAAIGVGDVPHVVAFDDVADPYVAYATIIDNTVTGTGRALIRVAGAAFSLRASILAGDGIPPTSSVTGLVGQRDCLMLANNIGLESATRSVVSTPVFVDRGDSDYRPVPDAPQVDFCDAATPAIAPIDLGGGAVPTDYAATNRFGAYDLGAYELQEIVFANGFE